MRRSLLTLALAGVAGLLLTAGSAQACHKKRCPHTCAPTPVCAPAPAPVCAPAPVPVIQTVCAPAPAPVCAPAPACAPAPKHCGKAKKHGGLLGGLCGRKKARCETVAVSYAPAPCAVPTYAPSYGYATPQATYAAPQAPYAAPAPQAPTKG